MIESSPCLPIDLGSELKRSGVTETCDLSKVDEVTLVLSPRIFVQLKILNASARSWILKVSEKRIFFANVKSTRFVPGPSTMLRPAGRHILDQVANRRIRLKTRRIEPLLRRPGTS